MLFVQTVLKVKKLEPWQMEALRALTKDDRLGNHKWKLVPALHQHRELLRTIVNIGSG